MATASDPLTDLLRPERLTAVVDIGAGSYDLTTRCIHFLAARSAVAADAVGQYLAMLGKR